MSGAYLCIFTFIFLGIMGAVNIVLFIGSLGSPQAPPVYITPDGCDDVEGKVRSALKSTDGDVVIVIPRKLSEDAEFAEICRALVADCSRVCIDCGK